MGEPNSDVTAVALVAAGIADRLAAIGSRYQTLVESLMYDHHGIHCFGTDLEQDDDISRMLLPDAGSLRTGQLSALDDFHDLDVTSTIRKLKDHGSGVVALQILWQAVSKI